MAVTIRDVAIKAGVSQATVSRVLNGKKWVKPETRERVFSAIADLNYSPNDFARFLGSGAKHTGIISVIIANPYESLYEDAVFFEIIKGIGDIVEEKSYSLLLSRISGKCTGADEIPSAVDSKLVDGIIVGGIPIEEKFIRELFLHGLPVVLIGKYESCPGYRILVDNVGGGYKATEHLIRLGHRRIGIIYGPLKIYSFNDKVIGYRQAFQDYGLPVNEQLMIEEDDFRSAGGYSGMERLMRQEMRPTAVFITDIMMAVGAMRYLKEHAFRVPEDVAIVGYCGGNLSDMMETPLTAIRIDERNIGHSAARLLFDIIEGRVTSPIDITLSTRLVIRKSCGAPMQ